MENNRDAFASVARGAKKAFQHCPTQYATLGGVDTLITAVECENPIAEVHFVKGFKSSPFLYEQLLEELAENNINVVLVTLPDPLDEIDYLEDYEKLVKAVYIDGELDGLTNTSAPRFASNHSTGGFLLTKLLMDEDNAKSFKSRYESALFASPFYGSAYHSTGLFAPLAKLYSRIFSERAVGTTWLERQFYKAATATQSYEEMKEIANHRQALYMNGPTKELMENVRARGFPEALKSMPISFVLGRQDQVSYNLHSHEVANAMSAEVHTLEGGHSQHRKRKFGRDFIVNNIKSHVHEMQNPGVPYVATPAANDNRELNAPEHLPAGPS